MDDLPVAATFAFRIDTAGVVSVVRTPDGIPAVASTLSRWKMRLTARCILAPDRCTADADGKVDHLRGAALAGVPEGRAASCLRHRAHPPALAYERIDRIGGGGDADHL